MRNRPTSRREGQVDPDLLPTGGLVPGGFEPAVLACVAVGGSLGALARYGLGRALPTAPGTFPTTTLLVNLTGCLLLGVLMGALARVQLRSRPLAPTPFQLLCFSPLLRPLLGTGVLGGYTTFSTFAVETDRLLGNHQVGLALAYLAASLLGGMLAASGGWLSLQAHA